MIRVSSLEPTSDRTVNSFDSRSISSSLSSWRNLDRPVGDLDVVEPELAQPLDQRLEPVLGDRQLGQRPAEHDRDLVLGGSARASA